MSYPPQTSSHVGTPGVVIDKQAWTYIVYFNFLSDFDSSTVSSTYQPCWFLFRRNCPHISTFTSHPLYASSVYFRLFYSVSSIISNHSVFFQRLRTIVLSKFSRKMFFVRVRWLLILQIATGSLDFNLSASPADTTGPTEWRRFTTSESHSSSAHSQSEFYMLPKSEFNRKTIIKA